MPFAKNYFKLTSIKNKLSIPEDGGEDVDMATFRPFTYVMSWSQSSKNTAQVQHSFDTDAIHSV